MEKRELNFSSFSQSIQVADIGQWNQWNVSYSNHPESGTIPFNGPRTSCVEIIEQRKIDERYFINPDQPSEFFIQHSLGDLHYQLNDEWVTIDHRIKDKGNGLYVADQQMDPVGFEIFSSLSFIKTLKGKVHFNQWKLMGMKSGELIEMAVADWSNYSAGDDGIYITDIFPGIDAEMRVLRGAVKTSFIIKQLHYADVESLVFTDHFDVPYTGSHLEFINGVSNQAADGVRLICNEEALVEIGQAIAYPEKRGRDLSCYPEYILNGNTIGLIMPVDWIEAHINDSFIIVDPPVTSSNTLAQASIIGSRYDATCGFTQSCNYNLSVNTPPAATFTNIQWDFDYIAAGACYLQDGAVRFTLGNCLSPSQSGYYWFCNLVGTGTCYGNYISCFNDLSACLPPPSCVAQTLNFGMQFFRSCWGSTGCSSTCIGAGSPWIMTIQGKTVEFSAASPNEISLSATSVCVGQNVIASSLGEHFGMAPYTLSWSLNVNGIPSLGTGSSLPVSFSTSGTQTIYCTLTDACGGTALASKSITVLPQPPPPTVISPLSYCQNVPAPSLTAVGSGLQWYGASSGGIPVGAPTPSTSNTGTTSYYVSQTLNGCESARAKIDVVVNALPIVSGIPSIAPSSCGGADGGITGLSASGQVPFTYVWSTPAPNIVSTSVLDGNLSNQPAGTYFLGVTDGNGCPAVFGPVVIPNFLPPQAPLVNSPVTYCLGASASALTAAGSNLLWYTTSSGGLGNGSAPVPLTSTPGTISYYVSQTVSGCEGARAQIDVIVLALPSPPVVVSPVDYCLNEISAPLAATGNNLLWYTNATGGQGESQAPTPSTTDVLTTSYFVSQTIGNCESNRALIQVIVRALPVITGVPLITPANCGSASGGITGLNTSGSGTLTYTWTDELSNVVSTTASTAVLTNQYSGDYFLSVTDAYQCMNTYGPVTIPVINPPLPPTVQSPVTWCQGAITTALNAVGSDLQWYSTSTGGIMLPAAPVPSSAIAGTSSYYVSQTIDGCESEYAQIDIVINPTPVPPVAVSPLEYCEGASAAALNATGTDLLWYTSSSGGSGSSVSPVPATSSPGVFSYYVSQSLNTCESGRTTIDVVINPLPVFSGSAVTVPSSCGNADGTINGIVVSGNGALTYVWSDALSEIVSTSMISADVSGLASGEYTLTVTDENNCSADYAPVNVTAINGPSAPAVSDVEYCVGDLTSPLTASGTNLLWYSDATGGNALTGAPLPSAEIEGTFTYYVSQTANGCESERSSIDVRIWPVPVALFSVSAEDGCVPLCVQFNDHSTSVNSAVISWEWMADGTFISADSDPSYCFLSAGIFDILLSVTDANGCTATVNSVDYIHAEAAPMAVFSTDKTETSVTNPEFVFTNESIGESTVFWDFGDDVVYTDDVVSYLFPGVGTWCVKLIAQSELGCTNQYESCVQIRPDFFLFIPNAFTPDNDDVNDVWQPVSRGTTYYLLRIFNRWGDLVFESEDPSTPWMGDTRDGLYYAQDGIYSYMLIVKDSKNVPYEFTGHISLLR